MNTNAKIFLSIFFGVALGIIVGYEVRAAVPMLQWIAPIAGAIFSYIAVDFRGAVKAIPTAFAVVREALPSKARFAIYRWRFYWMLTISTYIFLICFWITFLDSSVGEDGPAIAVGLTIIFTLIAGIGFTMYCEEERSVSYRGEEWVFKRTVEDTLVVSPHRVLFRHTPRAIWFLVTKGIPYTFAVAIPWIFRQIRTFVVQWFRIVHSNLRLLCLADTFLFASLGLILGGPIVVWMLAGGLFGIVNYQVVSIRWLKLVPVVQEEST